MLKIAVLVVYLTYVISATRFPVDQEVIGKPKESSTGYKLPEDVKPTHYDIELEPNFIDDTFKGTVTIDVKIEKETKNIILHKNLITLDNPKITRKADPIDEPNIDESETVEVVVEAPNYDENTHFYKIILVEPLKTTHKEVQITISYTGVLGTNNKGFYLAQYTDENDVVKKFATTQFESTSAREAFPCFDQPDMKAKFTIRIKTPENYKSVSNMPLVTPGDGVVDVFQTTTVDMPTYLVAFLVSELEVQESEKQNDVSYSVYGVPKFITENRGYYAIESGKAIVEKIEDFLDVKYSLPKLDQVAIPDEYFSAGAMENWGLVTYKEKYLLHKEKVSTASEKQGILSIIAHEFGHQWFGNIVTPKWWSVLWLSEGFATYFEHYAADKVDPGMKMMEQFVTLVNHVALESDTDSTRPMEQDVGTPADISSIFDNIAYEKGGAVIRMMENFLTTEVFRAGLKNYLEARKEQTATPEDLWEAMQVAFDAALEKPIVEGEEIAPIMATWNTAEGYPVVTLKKKEDDSYILTQTRFRYEEAVEDNTLWKIPINYATKEALDFSKTTAQLWLTETEVPFEIELKTGEWIIFNKQQTGFYRVNYPLEIWEAIIDYLLTKDYAKIHVLNRAQLIDDSFNLARAGIISYEIPLRLSLYLVQETEYVPFVAFLRAVQFLNNRMVDSEHYKYLKAFVNEAISGAYKTLGVDDKGSHTEKLNRANVIAWLCRFADETCSKAMHDKLTKKTDDAYDAVEPDLQNAAYCGGMRRADAVEEKFKRLYALYNGAQVEYLEQGRALAGMGCSLDEAWLKTLMRAAIGEEKDYAIRDADKVAAFTAVYSSSDVGVRVALNFVAENLNKIKTTFTEDNKLNLVKLRTIFNGIASRTSSKSLLDKLNGIVDEDLDDILKVAKTTAEANVKFANEKLAKANEWFQETYGSAGFITVSISLLFSMLVVLALF